ncbi:MAG: mechanosensitive ion channel family protein [Actinomycetota bacterium]
MPVLGSLSSVADWLEGDGLRILAVVVAAVLVSWIGRAIVKRNRRRLEESASADETISLQRLTTVTRVLADAVTVVVWAIAIIVILSQLNVNLAAVLTTAGIAGLALAFAAQNLLRDVMSGFFIVLENQYDVGDLVEIHVDGESTSGWVRGVTFRSTSLEMGDGLVVFVPNGNIKYAVNRSRGRGHVSIRVDLPDGEDIERVQRAVEEEVNSLREERGLTRSFFAGPNIERVQEDGAGTLLVHVETRPERSHELEELLRSRIDRRVSPIAHDARVVVPGHDSPAV